MQSRSREQYSSNHDWSIIPFNTQAIAITRTITIDRSIVVFEFEFQNDPVDAEVEVQSRSREQYSSNRDHKINTQAITIDRSFVQYHHRNIVRGWRRGVMLNFEFEFQTDPVDEQVEMYHDTRSILKQSRSIDRDVWIWIWISNWSGWRAREVRILILNLKQSKGTA